jgi:hypothetical protein
LERLKISELNIYILEKFIQEFVPEISEIYNVREDESEEQQVKTGRLHESRILGIMLKFYLEGKKRVTTRDVEFEYKKYYKQIARSTVSTYLNMLKSESTLYKERDGRVVYYILSEEPPQDLSAFWFTRLFCIDPPYFFRAIYFASLFSIAERIVENYSTNGDTEKLVYNLKYILGILILLILKKRADKCVKCQFGKAQKYNELITTLENALKERSDVLSDELMDTLKICYAEIPIFGGLNLEEKEVKMIEDLLEFSNKYRKDIEFQTMVLNRRLDLKNLQDAESNFDTKEEKAIQ